MFTVRITPRFCETDALGHINNTVMPVWLEQGRTPIFELFTGDLTHSDLSRFPLLLAHLSMDFRRPIQFGTDVEVRTSVSRIGNSSFELSQSIAQNAQNCLDAKAVIVHVDVAENASAPIPDTVRKQLLTCMRGTENGKTHT